MLDKSEEGTRYIQRNQFESAIVPVPNAFSVASARRDERESRESRPGNKTRDIFANRGDSSVLFAYLFLLLLGQFDTKK